MPGCPLPRRAFQDHRFSLSPCPVDKPPRQRLREALAPGVPSQDPSDLLAVGVMVMIDRVSTEYYKIVLRAADADKMKEHTVGSVPFHLHFITYFNPLRIMQRQISNKLTFILY